MNINISKIKKLTGFNCCKLFIWTSIYFLFFNSISCNTTEPTNNSDGIDTTSHNFTFQTCSFGEHSSSILYDVAIINENNIWAVGEIYMNDSLGQPDPHPYGIMHWNGSDWNVQKITAQNPSGGYSYITPTGIFNINPSEIWLASGGVFRFDVQNIIQSFWLINYSGYTGGIFNNGETAQKISGISITDIYAVGNKGAIARYNGVSWQKIESGTELDIYDIVGKQNINNVYEVICVAAKQSVNSNKKIYRIENSILTELNVNGIASSIRGIWFKSGEKYYVVGSGMYYKNNINSIDSWISFGETVTPFYTNAIDGNDLNDIVVCGAYGELLHYNGSSWKSYQNQLEMQAGSYRSIKIKNNLLVAVGYDSPKAVITIGRR